MEVNKMKMKEYLIRIESGHTSECTTISGDCPGRPFTIANNLWNYTKPGYAAQRLEKLAKSWESHGRTVKRIYGTVFEMPTIGSKHNVSLIQLDYGWIDGRE
jgi:hypothetical protein